MRKLLRPQDVFLLGLSGVADFLQELHDPFELVSKSYDVMYGWVPSRFRRHHFNHLVWRSIKTGYIEKIEKGEEIYIRLTSHGKEKITRDFPLLTLQKKAWDKKWRVVLFDIEEANRKVRDSLRQKLKELGFGMLQESVFISPHDVAEDMAEFIESVALERAVYVFETEKLLVGDQRQLSSRVWKLDSLNEKYEALIEKIESKYLKSNHDRIKKLNKGDIWKIREEYLAILLSDPFLPKELLPHDWKGDVVRDYIKRFK